MEKLRKSNASLGLMLESTSQRLREKGGAHYYCPDKDPEVRLRMHAEAGELRIPFTSGILLGIGENDAERVDTLIAIRDLDDRYGHIQEVIVQPFHPKPGTPMAGVAAISDAEVAGWVAIARLVLGPQMNVQAPPNLAPNLLELLLRAGVNDWGGVSPLTIDFINPSAVAGAARSAPPHRGRPASARRAPARLSRAPARTSRILRAARARGRARARRRRGWVRSGGNGHDRTTAREDEPRRGRRARPRARGPRARPRPTRSCCSARTGPDFHALLQTADAARALDKGDDVSFVICRNINFTNVCYVGCTFCGFSRHEDEVDAYDHPMEKLVAKARDAVARGATEVCIQGGIHPRKDHTHYRDILVALKREFPKLHIHAFSPEEIHFAHQKSGMPLKELLAWLVDAGLGTMPGTAAEILDDEIRRSSARTSCAATAGSRS
jgi:FO synthase